MKEGFVKVVTVSKLEWIQRKTLEILTISSTDVND